VVAVRGNVDTEPWARILPLTTVVEVEGHTIYILHDLGQLDLEPSQSGIHVVVSGHSHKPRIEDRNGVHYLNPGSAGPRRFDLPITVARLTTVNDRPSASLIELTRPLA
jgi:putative phosphoesterase